MLSSFEAGCMREVFASDVPDHVACVLHCALSCNTHPAAHCYLSSR